jgi:hypothetical protein
MIQHIPVIAPEEYPAFRKLIAELPEDHQHYLQDTNNKRAMNARTWEAYEYLDVNVSAPEFRKWCEAKCARPSLRELDKFARAKQRTGAI